MQLQPILCLTMFVMLMFCSWMKKTLEVRGNGWMLKTMASLPSLALRVVSS